MASHKSVVHVQRGFRMSKNYAEQVMRDHCSITWVIEGETIRDTTDEERRVMRAEQAQIKWEHELREGILTHHELRETKFERPKTTKYRAPREAYEEMDSPLAVRTCRWPRAADAPSKAA